MGDTQGDIRRVAKKMRNQDRCPGVEKTRVCDGGLFQQDSGVHYTYHANPHSVALLEVTH